MLKVGIDAMSFYTSRHYLDLGVLANARGIDPDKYYLGLGQQQMAVTAPNEDIITMACHAGERVLAKIDKQDIDTLLFATESGIDHSKSAGIYVHQLLDLPHHCRTLEVKQACYSCTGAMQLILPRLLAYPDKKTLLIASDVARYGLNTPGESSQGCGAVAMILSANPRILAIEPYNATYTEDVMDFWRPNYLHDALVDGKYSSRLYLHTLEKTWQAYRAASGHAFDDHAAFCYHSPVPRLVEKAHKALAKLNHKTALSDDDIALQVKNSLIYARKTGNSYSASLYMGLISLLDHSSHHLSDQRIGFYSYGSGCVAEFFSGILQKNYHQQLDTAYHNKMLASRIALDYAQYEAFYNFTLPEDGRYFALPPSDALTFCLSHIENHKRIYQKQSS